MDYVEITLLSIALAMDCFAVSLCRWALIKTPRIVQWLLVGLYFGWFQFLFTIAWWYLWYSFNGYIERYDHWIAFIFLVCIWWKMIHEAYKWDLFCQFLLSHKVLFLLAIATSIDAFGVWLSFSILNKPIFIYATAIGVVSFIFSVIGMRTWILLDKVLRKKSEIFWWVLLIWIWFNILYQHLS